MRIYISGQISNLEKSYYMERFECAELRLTVVDGYSVVNPTKVNAQLPADTSYEDYMKMSFCMLDMCDAIYMLDGWEESRGANREYGYAIAKGKKVIFESEGEAND